MNIKSILVLTCVLWMTGGLCAAQTPDGSSPNSEGVCNGLQETAPRLYGLCLAYCEALDCELLSLGDGGEAIQCNRPADSRILDLYNRHRRAGDPAMPCLPADPGPCPCWSTGEIDDVLPVVRPGTSSTNCRNDLDPTASGITCATLNSAGGPCSFVYLTFNGAAQVGYFPEQGYRCGYVRGSSGPTAVVRSLAIDAATAAACLDQLSQQGAAAGFSCFGP